MPTIGQLVVNLLGNAQPLQRELARAKADVGSLATSIGAAAVVTATLAGAANAVKLAAEYESTETSFTVLLRSATEAKKVLADLTQFAASTPLQFPDVENGAKQLLGYGFSAQQLIPSLKMLGDVGSALKIPLNDLIYLYGTSSAQAHLFTKDINQFASRGIPIISELAKVLNVSKSEVMALTEAGGVNFSHLQQALENLTGAGGQFEGTMAAAAGTLEGRFSNLQDNVTIAMREIGIEIVKAFDLKGALESMIEFTGQIRNAVKNYGAEVAAVIRIVISFTAGMAAAKLAMLAYQAAQKLATTGAIMFQAVTNPAFIFQIAAGLLAAAWACDQMNETFNKATNDANTTAEATGRIAGGIQDASQAANFLKLEMEKVPEALEKQLALIKVIQAEKARDGSLTANRQAKLDQTIGTVAAMTEFGDSVTKVNTKLEAAKLIYKQLSDANASNSDNEFKLKGVEDQIGKLTGVNDAIKKIKDEIAELKTGEHSVQVDKFAGLGATQGQLDELKKQQAELDKAKQGQKDAKEGKDAATRLAEATRTPLEKLHGELERLQKLKDEGHINDELMARGADKAGKEFDQANKKDAGEKRNPISAVTKGSAEAQNLIVRAMQGSSNPNKVLEAESKKQTAGLREVATYLRTMVTKREHPVTVVSIP